MSTSIRSRGGFLSFKGEPESADVVTTRSALHQLPDTWKQVALCAISGLLKRGGTLYLWGAMWSFDAHETLEQLPAWIDAMGRPQGEGFTRAMFETHVREEFSTFSWILEGMIERAGLTIREVNHPAPWYGEILATKR